MFYSCSGLTELDLSKFDTRNVRSVGVFRRQAKLPLNEIDNEDNAFSRLYQGAPEMFFECVRLNKFIIKSRFNRSEDNPYKP